MVFSRQNTVLLYLESTTWQQKCLNTLFYTFITFQLQFRLNEMGSFATDVTICQSQIQILGILNFLVYLFLSSEI